MKVALEELLALSHAFSIRSTSDVSTPKARVARGTVGDDRCCWKRPLESSGSGTSGIAHNVGSADRLKKGRTTMAHYAVAQLDDIDEFDDAGASYRPIRHHLGITAFGVTAWTGHAAGDVVVNDRDEDDPTADQELFLVLRGHAAFDVEGDRVDAPAGTLVFAPPNTKRKAFAIEDDATILALEGTPGKAFAARGWELWAPMAHLYQAGEYAEVADRLAASVQANPQYPMLFFNLACCEAQSGRTSGALDHLRRAIEMSEEFRESARDDSDLDPIRDEPVFKQLVEQESSRSST
jgi:hypothetical protein